MKDRRISKGGRPSARSRLLWTRAVPILALVGAALFAASDLLDPPTSPGTPNQLGMPGDRPADAVEKPQNTGFALEMRGTLIAASAEQLVIRRPGELDAVIFLTPQTAITVDGDPTTFDDLQAGGKVVVIFNLEDQRRIATSVDASLPGGQPPRRNAAEPIVPQPPGARIEDGLPPDAAPEMPPAEAPPLEERR